MSRKKKGAKILHEAVVEIGTEAAQESAAQSQPGHDTPESSPAESRLQADADEALTEEQVLDSASEKVAVDVIEQLAAEQLLADEIVEVGSAESAEPGPAEAASEEHGSELGEEAAEAPPSSGLWSIERLRPVLEAVVFAAADPLPVRRMRDVIEGATADEIKAALAALREDYAHRGIRLIEVAGGWQLRTAPEHHDVVRKLFKERPFKLSRAAIETLSVVAYRQPVTRAEVESVRGVDASGVLESLVERHLIRIAGRRDVPGRPLVYTTTHEFLETFGLKDLKSLPTLPELGDDIRAMAEQSGFNEAAEDRNAAILPLEAGEESSGDENEAARSVERTDPVGEERNHDEAPGDHRAHEEGRDVEESPADRP